MGHLIRIKKREAICPHCHLTILGSTLDKLFLRRVPVLIAGAPLPQSVQAIVRWSNDLRVALKRSMAYFSSSLDLSVVGAI